MRPPSTERPKLARHYAAAPISTRVVMGANSLARSHERLEAKEPGPPEAGQGRKPAAPVARSASLDGPLVVRQLLSKRSWLRPALRSVSPKREVRTVPSRTLILNAFQIEAALRHLAWRVAGCKNECADKHIRPNRPGHTSRLLSCHRSVGGLRLASPAQFFAKLRSDKNQAKRSGSSFRADSLQPLCRLFGGPHVRHVRQMDRSQDAGAASAVPVVC
jgi:hypothetical protein